MSDDLLLVPGTAGTKLLQSGTDIGWPAKLYLSAFLAGQSLLPRLPFGDSADAIISMFSMEHADEGWAPTKSTLDPGKSITAGPKLGVAYNQAGSFECFSYDWRCDIRHSAEQLVSFLEQAKRPAKGRWKLLGHSQGGLVIIAASKLWARAHGDASDAFSEVVSHVGLLGVPLMGTVSSAAALAFGEELGGAFSDHFIKVARTWPALYQMLPIWRGSVRGADGQALPFNCMADEAWPDAEVSRPLLARARSVRREFLNSPLSRMARVKVRITLSLAHATANHVILAGGRHRIGSAREAGDSLVPYETTCRLLSHTELQYRHGIGARSRRNTAVHSLLADDPNIWSSLMEFFKR